jgi:hypothetical protein
MLLEVSWCHHFDNAGPKESDADEAHSERQPELPSFD